MTASSDDLSQSASNTDGSPQQAPTATAPLRFSLVVPVFNEGANIGTYLRTARATLGADGYELLVCYDFDGDNTLPAITAVPEAEKPACVRLVRNDLGKGVRYAIEAGFKAATAPVVIVSMADLSDDLAAIPAMLAKAEAGAAVVSGSRYMRGGRQIGGPWFKGFLSRAAGTTLRWFTGLPTYDATNSFRAYRREFLAATPIESTAGFCLGLELTVKAHFHGHRVEEVPSTWQDRVAGESRFKLMKWLPHYLQWYLWAFRARWFGDGPKSSSPIKIQQTNFLLIAIFVLGLSTRFDFIRTLGATDYESWARKEYFGGISTAYLSQAQKQNSTGTYPPGYPSFIRWVVPPTGHPFDSAAILVVRYSQALLDGLGVLMIFYLLRWQRASQNCSLTGALCYAINPAFAFGSTVVMAEWCNPILMLLIMCSWCRAQEEAGVSGYVFGFLAGAIGVIWSTFRGETLIILPILVLASLILNGLSARHQVAAILVGAVATFSTLQFGSSTYGTTNTLSNNFKWYALWNGLGDIPNSVGYYSDDDRTTKMLSTIGLRYHTPDAEVYFQREYFQAWRTHPSHVVSCIAFRWRSILFACDHHYCVWGERLKTIARLAIVAHWILPIVWTGFLIYSPRQTSLLVAMPIAAALLSIGLIHYEARYTRHVDVAYIVATCLTLSSLSPRSLRVESNPSSSVIQR